MADKVKKDTESRKSGGGYLTINDSGFNEFEPVGGETYRLDFVPYIVNDKRHHMVRNGSIKVGEEWFCRQFYIHFNIGEDNHAVLCPKTFGKACPICEHVQEAYDSRDEKAIKDVKEILRKERFVYNVMDLDSDDPEEILLWNISYHLFTKQLGVELKTGDDARYGFADTEDGYTLEVRFIEGTYGKIKFPETNRIDFEEREDYGSEILDETCDLDSLLNNIKTYDELNNLLWDIDEDSPEDKPDRSSRKSSGRGRGRKDKKEESSSRKSSGRGRGRKDKKEESSSHGRGRKKDKKDKSNDSDKGRGRKDKESRRKKKEEKLTCPSDLNFGTDCDEYEDCDTCKIFIECEDARAKMDD